MNIHIPTLLSTDAYKQGHGEQRDPRIKQFKAYYAHRGTNLTNEDNRIVYYGMRWFFESFLSVPITMDDVLEADDFLATFGVGETPYDYPRDLFVKMIEENNGYWPVTIKSLPEGTCVHPTLPCFTIMAEEPYEGLGNWLESIMMHMWSPTVTATKSAMVSECLRNYFDKSVDPENHYLFYSRFHDFGFRGTSSSETAMVTGTGHLLFFDGTDTLTAAWLARKWNNRKAVGQSITATEHSVMTTWDTELNATINYIKKAKPNSVVSVVADSYNYLNFLKNVVPQIVELCRSKNIFLVVRPDSGEPIQAVLDGLFYLEKAFGSTINSLGFKVINGAGIIQGDGLNIDKLFAVAHAVYVANWSAQCVAYGMGGGLLQVQDRDTFKVAIKACEVTHQDGSVHPVMKKPATDILKISLPGDFVVYAEDPLQMHNTNLSAAPYVDCDQENWLETIWDKGPCGFEYPTFAEVRNTARITWAGCDRFHDPLSDEMKAKVMAVQETLNK